MVNRSTARLILAGAALLLLVGCNREASPTYAPPPVDPAVPSAGLPSSPVPAGGEQLTIARACASDVERFCTGVPPRQGMIKQCMKAHVAELSAGCFDAVMSAIAARQAP
ncbi:MAG: cysteine rich repeat-containing protein [Geminicoccaceae bacterium]